MKSLAKLATVALVFALIGGGTMGLTQGIYKIPFKFQAGGKKFPPGEYLVDQKEDGPIILRQESTGKEIQIPFITKLTQPIPPVEEPQLVFNMVGNFEPSYTEYVTDYVLAEVWLPGQDGLQVHTLKGAHKNQTIKGTIAKK
jgi:hypothetical protein